MGSKNCFKIKFKLKKSKKDKLKQEKNTDEDSSNIPNEGFLMDRTVPSRMVHEIAATRIQNAFRSFLERRTKNHLRGADKFEALIQDHMAKEQTETTLNYIHSWGRIQDQIKARRLGMITEARVKRKNMENQLKHDAKINELEVEWCNGSETMEEILSRIHQREEAAVRRERALAYAFSHQWRPNCSQYFGQASYSLGKESWGWSWKERWVAARPWEVRVRAQTPKMKLNVTKTDKINHDESKVRSAKSPISNGKDAEKRKENNPSIKNLPK